MSDTSRTFETEQEQLEHARRADGDGFDYVRCTYCDWVGEAPRGADVCPNCGTDGSLMDPPWLPS